MNEDSDVGRRLFWGSRAKGFQSAREPRLRFRWGLADQRAPCPVVACPHPNAARAEAVLAAILAETPPLPHGPLGRTEVQSADQDRTQVDADVDVVVNGAGKTSNRGVSDVPPPGHGC
jgi:hypothetical protein